jgi:hypothetical protein
LGYKERDRASEDDGGIPLFDGEKQQKMPIPALRGPKATLQVFDSVWFRREFRYAAEQRNFFGLAGELNDRSAELQRNFIHR